MIDSVDFCISFIGENSGLLARVFFGTLKKHCDLSAVTFHLVNKQVSTDMWAEIVRLANLLDRPTLIYELDTGWAPYRGDVDSWVQFDTSVGTPFRDPARTADWCVDNCGSAEWCILSHFDVVWRKDIVKWLVEKQAHTGAVMVGAHCPIMLLNREAYRRCGVNFDSGGGDVGTSLAGAMGAVNFPDAPNMEWCFHHLGGGGGYHTNEEFRDMRARAIELVELEGLQ